MITPASVRIQKLVDTQAGSFVKYEKLDHRMVTVQHASLVVVPPPPVPITLVPTVWLLQLFTGVVSTVETTKEVTMRGLVLGRRVRTATDPTTGNVTVTKLLSTLAAGDTFIHLGRLYMRANVTGFAPDVGMGWVHDFTTGLISELPDATPVEFTPVDDKKTVNWVMT